MDVFRGHNEEYDQEYLSFRYKVLDKIENFEDLPQECLEKLAKLLASEKVKTLFAEDKIQRLDKKAKEHFEKEEYEEAKTIYQKLRYLKPNDYEVSYNLGSLLLSSRQYEDANNAFISASRIDGSKAEAWYYKGFTYEHLNYYEEEALESYQKAVALKTDYPEALSRSAVCLNQAERYKEAITLLENATHLSENIEMLESLANAYYNRERYDKSIEVYKQILAMKPKDELVWYDLGDAYYSLENYEESAKAYEKTVGLKEDFGVHS